MRTSDRLRGRPIAAVCALCRLSHAGAFSFLEVIRLLGLPPLPRNLAAALRDIASKRADTRRSALLDLLRHVDSDQRAQVVEAIARLLRADPDSEVRAIAALGAADMELRELVPALVHALEDVAPRVQQMALLALGELDDRAAPSGLLAVERLLTSQFPALRYQALVAWSRLAGASGVAEMLRATSDTDEEVRWIAWTLLEKELFETEKLQATARESASSELALRVHPSAGIDRLRPYLEARVEDESIRIRSVVGAISYRLGEPFALARLLECAQSESKLSRRDLAHLAKEFGRLRFEPARPWLAARARRGWLEGSVGWPALVALAALGDSAATASVIDELSAPSVRRRTRALVAIGELRLQAALGKVTALRANPAGLEPALIEQTCDVLGARSLVR